MLRRGKQALVLVTVVLGMGTTSGGLAGTPDESIGLFTAVQGKVTVTHPGTIQILPVNVRDDVFFKDVIETRGKSRTKAFFDDETILTVGENSRVTVTEHIYNPDLDVRRVVVNLFLGKLRALVGKAFTGEGSKFEIHTPTAVAAARGTYFVVWVDPSGASGIANIGESGKVDFTSGGKTVTVAPGEYSLAAAGKRPEMPSIYRPGPETALQSIVGTSQATLLSATSDLTAGLSNTIGNTLTLATEALGTAVGTVNALAGTAMGTPAELADAIEGTNLMEAPPVETPEQIVRALGLSTAPMLPSAPGVQPTSLRASIPAPDVTSNLGKVETLANQVLSAPSIVSGPLAATVGAVGGAVGSTLTAPAVIPPAVTSGVTEGLGLPLP